jgi:hypothetical protein
VTGLLVYLAVVVAFTALWCGHVGEDWPLSGAWSALSARLPTSSPSEASESLPHPPGASQARSRHSAPTWARTDKDTP